MGRLPLADIVVLDFGRVASAPFMSMLLADFGARVIKIERPGTGDDVRSMGRPIGSDPLESDYYVGLNRSKESVVLDLRTPDSVEFVKKLAASADIVIENFRPGVADRLGIGFDDLAPLRRGLVYTSISGFGSSGPWAERTANDILMQSLSGLMSLTGEPDRPPVRMGASVSDLGAGLFALAGTLAALRARDEYPEGQHIEVPMFDASVGLLPNLVPIASRGIPVRRAGRGHVQILGYGSFECADGKYLTVGAFTERFWRILVEVLEIADQVSGPEYETNGQRVARREALDPILDAAFKQKPVDEWERRFRDTDVPVAPVLDLDEALASAQAEHNDVVWRLAQGGASVGVAGNPVRSEQWPEYEPRPAPTLGQHTDEVTRQWGTGTAGD